MSVATKDRFKKRVEEGCDIECDELWSKLKKQSTEKADISTCSPQHLQSSCPGRRPQYLHLWLRSLYTQSLLEEGW